VTSSYDFINRPEDGLPMMETHTGDFEVQYRFIPAKHHQITVGLSDRVISDLTPASGLIAFNPSQLTYQVASGFAQDEVHLLNDRILLTFGAVLEHDPFAGWELQPTARALWAPNTRHSLWIAISQAARTPTLYERDVTAEFGSEPGTPATFGLSSVGVNTGSKQFQSEILKAYEIGYRAQTSPRFSIDITAFYDDYHHLESETPGTPGVAGGAQPYIQAPYYFSNRVNAHAPGGEIALIYHPVSRWKLAGSYSYLNLHARFLDNTPLGEIDSSPNAFPSNQWKLQSYLNLSKTVQFDSFLFSTSSVDSVVYPFGDKLLPPHTRVDARLAWRVTPRFEVSLSGQDLLSPRHIELLPEVLSPTGYAVRGYYLKTSWGF
jgi:iron complex outermembrane receptor protein